MINLLPDTEVLKRLREYRSRKRVVAGGLFLGLVVMAMILSGTIYFGLYLRRQAAVQTLAGLKQESETIASAALAADLAGLDEQVRLLSGVPLAESPFVSLLERVLGHRNQGIRITNIRYVAEAEGEVIDLAGVALSRQSLLAFIEAFKNDEAFASIDSPISNLIKDRDVPFTLSIVVAETQ